MGEVGRKDPGDAQEEALVQNRKRKKEKIKEKQRYVRVPTERNTTNTDRKVEEGKPQERDHREQGKKKEREIERALAAPASQGNEGAVSMGEPLDGEPRAPKL